MPEKEGFYFEDLSVGKVFETGYSAPITKKEVEIYCSLTGETNPTHVYDKYSKQFGLKGLVVPGYLIPPVSAGLVKRDCPLEIIVIAESSAKFVKPIYLGDCIRVKNEVIAKEDMAGKPYGKVIIKREVYNRANELCAILTADLRITKKAVKK